jgi:hypothetical protein
MQDGKRLKRRWRIATVLALGALMGILISATPAGAHFQASIDHIWSHIKPKADARYLQNTKTIVASDTALAGQHEFQTVMCPDGWQAIGGGVDPNNVLTMSVTSSGPIVDGDRTLLATNGTHGKSTGWWGAVRNNDAANQIFKVSVICAK